MIEWISNWAGAIIVAVIIATIIEMLLPEGNSKKYIKVVIGIYILFTIISPVISKFTGKSLAVSNLLDLNEYIEQSKQTEEIHNTLGDSNEQNIREIYISSLKKDLKNKVEAKGYKVNNLELKVRNDENYTLNSIYLSVVKLEETESEMDDSTNQVEKIETINTIQIQASNNEIEKEKGETEQLSNSEKNKLKEYLSSVYEISKKSIQIE